MEGLKHSPYSSGFIFKEQNLWSAKVFFKTIGSIAYIIFLCQVASGGASGVNVIAKSLKNRLNLEILL